MNPKKAPLAYVPLWAVREVALVFAEGVKAGRKPYDWCDRPWNLETALEYRSALLRHLEESEETSSALGCTRALASVIANAIILMYHEPHRIAADNDYSEEPGVEFDVDADAWKRKLEKAPRPKKPTQEELAEILDAEERAIDATGGYLAGKPPRMDETKIEVIRHTTKALKNVGCVQPDQHWHRLNGWIALVDGDGRAHYYDGPNAPRCKLAPKIPKGSLRNIYDDPSDADTVCELCLHRKELNQ